MFKIIKIFIGVNLISYSLMFYVMYLNLFTIGFGIKDYFVTILTNLETLLIIPGAFFIWHALHKNDKMV